MKFRVNDDYRIISDEHSWRVQRYKGVYRSGKRANLERWNDVGHYTTLENAVRALTERLIRESETETVSAAIKAIERVVAQIRGAVADLPLKILIQRLREVSIDETPLAPDNRDLY